MLSDGRIAKRPTLPRLRASRVQLCGSVERLRSAFPGGWRARVGVEGSAVARVGHPTLRWLREAPVTAGIGLFAIAVIGSLSLGLVLWQLWALAASAAAGSPADAAIGRLCQVFAGGCAAFLGAEFAGPLLVPSTQWDAASVRGCTAAAAVAATAVYVPVVHRWWHREPRVQLRHRLGY